MTSGPRPAPTKRRTSGSKPPRQRALRSDSFEAKLRTFFDDNQDEELTPDLLREKFGVSQLKAREIVGKLCRSGVLESVTVIRVRAKGARRDGP